MAGILYIISAPSGSGKSTLVNELRKDVTGLEFSVSFTTRSPRGSERPGMEYHFISREDFERRIARGEFLEYAEVFGQYYGTSRSILAEAERHGFDLILDIDVQGAAQVKESNPQSVSIFILPPSREVLESRLRNRSRAEGVIEEPEVALRLQEARKEIENSRRYDYILVNNVLHEATRRLRAVVLWERHNRGFAIPDEDLAALQDLAAHCRQENSSQRIRDVLASFASATAG